MMKKVTEEKVMDEQVKGKRQKKSVSYALKAIKVHIKTVYDEEDEMLSEEDYNKLKEIMNRTTAKYIKKAYGIG